MSNLAIALSTANFNRGSFSNSSGKNKHIAQKPLVWNMEHVSGNVVKAFSSSSDVANVVKRYATGEKPWKSFWAAIHNWKKVVASHGEFDGDKPSEWAIHFLEDFGERAARSYIPAPIPYFSSDGEIGVRWSSDKLMASLSITKDGKIFAFAKKPDVDPLRIKGFEDWYSNINLFLAEVKKQRNELV